MGTLAAKFSLLLILTVFSASEIRAEPSSDGFNIELSQLAEEELKIVQRLAQLREAIEKLPPSWKSEKVNKDKLLDHISALEIQTAKRWDLLIRNLSYLKAEPKKLPQEAILLRQDASKLALVHTRINQQLDHHHKLIRDGILMNLAEQIEVSGIN